MSAKKRIQGTGKKKPSSVRREARRHSRTRSGGKHGDALRERFRELLQDTGMSQAECARQLKVDASRVTEWISGRALPGADNLRRIGSEFGVSVDWLLGFDEVPRERAARAMIGILGEALYEEVRRTTPPYGQRDLGNPGEYAGAGSAAGFAAEVVEAWQRMRLQRHAAEWQERIRRLAERVTQRIDNGLFQELCAYHDADDVRRLLDMNVRGLREAAFRLMDPSVRWEDVELYHRSGWGFGYRGRDGDHVILTSRESLEPVERRGRLFFGPLYEAELNEGVFGLVLQAAEDRPPYLISGWSSSAMRTYI